MRRLIKGPAAAGSGTNASAFGFKVEKAAGLTTVTGKSSGLVIVCACGDMDGNNATDAAYELPDAWGVVASSEFEYDGKILPADAWMVVQNEPTPTGAEVSS